MPDEDLLSAASLAVDTYFRGENATKRTVRFDMESLRLAVNEAKKRAAQEDTTRIQK